MTKFRENLRDSYGGFLDLLSQFWKAYGGWSSLASSPYLHGSLILTLIMGNTWLNANWWDTVSSILPNMLGFTLGGYAILIGFGDEQFKSIISGSEDPNEESPFIGISAAFAHFIIIQLSALLFALIVKSLYFMPKPESLLGRILDKIPFWNDILEYSNPIFWFMGYLLFVYALSLAMASTFAVFRLSRWFDDYHNNKNKHSEQPQQPEDLHNQPKAKQKT